MVKFIECSKHLLLRKRRLGAFFHIIFKRYCCSATFVILSDLYDIIFAFTGVLYMALVRTLTHKDLPAIRHHFESLDRDSLQSRFMATLKPEFLVKYVEGFNFDKDILLGIQDLSDFSILGLAEIRPESDSVAEVAFTVIKGKQKSGLGKELVRRAFLAAQNRGYTHIKLVCLPENRSMRHLAEKFGMKLSNVFGDMEGNLDLARPDIYTKTEEIGEEIAANIAVASSKLVHSELEALSSLSKLMYSPLFAMMDVMKSPLFSTNSPEL